MLEQMRRQGASILIYAIFILLIVIFVYQMAPQGQGRRGGGGCSSDSNTAVIVDGQDTNQTSYLIAYSAIPATGRQKTYLALEWLIRRELLAQAAAAMGIQINGDLIDKAIGRGSFFLGGQRVDFANQFFSHTNPEDPNSEEFFDNKRFKGWVSQLNV